MLDDTPKTTRMNRKVTQGCQHFCNICPNGNPEILTPKKSKESSLPKWLSYCYTCTPQVLPSHTQLLLCLNLQSFFSPPGTMLHILCTVIATITCQRSSVMSTSYLFLFATPSRGAPKVRMVYEASARSNEPSLFMLVRLAAEIPSARSCSHS